MLIDTHLHIYDLMECFVAETPPLETLPETLFCSSSHYSDEFAKITSSRRFIVLAFTRNAPASQNWTP